MSVNDEPVQYVPLSEEEATWAHTPENVFASPWSWSDPIAAIVQDSHKFQLEEAFTWPHVLSVYQGIVRNLYSQGYVIARRADSPEPKQAPTGGES